MNNRQKKKQFKKICRSMKSDPNKLNSKIIDISDGYTSWGNKLSFIIRSRVYLDTLIALYKYKCAFEYYPYFDQHTERLTTELQLPAVRNFDMYEGIKYKPIESKVKVCKI